METTVARTYPEIVLDVAKDLRDSTCDRCSAEARVLAGRGRSRLALCGHHWRRHEELMIKEGWTVLATSLDKLAS